MIGVSPQQYQCEQQHREPQQQPPKRRPAVNEWWLKRTKLVKEHADGSNRFRVFKGSGEPSSLLEVCSAMRQVDVVCLGEVNLHLMPTSTLTLSFADAR